jgi:phytoene dehydrogenase-like protein
MGAGRYDVIVVGARVAGAATAMLLARQGLRVLAVDRVSFPSDTISSHQLQVPGVALLHRWGLLGKLAGALHGHQRRRDRAIRGMYDFTLSLAAFPPATAAQRLFLAAAAADQKETGRFLGAFAGIVPPEDYVTLGTVLRIFGTRGIRKLTTASVLPSARVVPRPRVPGRLPGGDRCGR